MVRLQIAVDQTSVQGIATGGLLPSCEEPETVIWSFFRKSGRAPVTAAVPVADRTAEFEQMLHEGLAILEATLLPEAMGQLEYLLRRRFSLHARWDGARHLLAGDLAALREKPELSLIFLHHGDGRIREAALIQLAGPVRFAASVYGLFWRLNDWEPKVRDAAAAAMKRCLPQTPAATLVPAFWTLMVRAGNWGRWTEEGRGAIDALISRTDVVDAFLYEITVKTRPRSAEVFGHLCRNPAVDPHLETIFRTARQPHIRAMALDSLLAGKVQWQTGDRTKVWIDRIYDKYRLQPVVQERDLSVAPDVRRLLETGAGDKAVIVRKRVADGLIRFRTDPTMAGLVDRLASRLENDPNGAVRDRIGFLRRKQSEEG